MNIQQTDMHESIMSVLTLKFGTLKFITSQPGKQTNHSRKKQHSLEIQGGKTLISFTLQNYVEKHCNGP